jgi:hypothetical protein
MSEKVNKEKCYQKITACAKMYRKISLNAHILCVQNNNFCAKKIKNLGKKRRQKIEDSCIRRTRRRWVVPGCETVHIVPDVGLLDVLQHRLLALIQSNY